jgi:ribonuclease-3
MQGSGIKLIELIRDPEPDVARIINDFIEQFNTVYGTPGVNHWDISVRDWQRYEFLGDRVLNLVVAQSLYSRTGVSLDEGEMTRILSSAVSNRALDNLSRTVDPDTFQRLIPPVINEQGNFGERITGGAFEAFIGALYCEFGLDDIVVFINAVLADTIARYDPDANAVGRLQEFMQKQGLPLPLYEEIERTGPDHRLFFTVRVTLGPGKSFTGTGPTLAEAKQDAARTALDRAGIFPGTSR